MSDYFIDNNTKQNKYFNNKSNTFYDSQNNYEVYNQNLGGNLNQKPYNHNQNKSYYPTQTDQFNQFYINNSNVMQSEDFKLMQSLEYVKENYSLLIDLNDKYRGLTQIVRNQLQPRFFVIKSFTEEDIHKVFYMTDYFICFYFE
jgi:hypothetical protein